MKPLQCRLESIPVDCFAMVNSGAGSGGASPSDTKFEARLSLLMISLSDSVEELLSCSFKVFIRFQANLMEAVGLVHWPI